MNPTAAKILSAAVQHVLETGSTNEDALARARRGASEPLWIRADRQVSGRGRQGRPWASPVGNLYCSLMLRVEAEPECLPQLAQVAAVALVDAIEATVGGLPGLCIKWPNDLLVGSAKTAGILVEASRSAEGAQACVIGCGVNCRSHPVGLPYAATNLATTCGIDVSPASVFDHLRTAMAQAIATWDDGRNYPAIRRSWLARTLPLETHLMVRAARGSISGRFQGIDAKGRLLLLGPDGPVTVEAGDVVLSDVVAASGG